VHPRKGMTHVVTTACVDAKYQECVAVCPVEAFRELPTYLVIDADECIDCGACIAECPVEAIFADTDVPAEEEHWIERNEIEALDAEIATGDSPVLADD
jgi:ferredoxin